MQTQPAVWFPTVKTNTGTDVFTERLVKGLNERGIRAEVTWLPLRSEYAPWTIPVPSPPQWATVVHVNTWLHPRFIPDNLPLVATIHHAVHHPDALNYKGRLTAAYHQYWIAPLERRVMRRASETIAVSKFVAETAKQTLLDIPLQVIYNGVDTSLFKPGNRMRKQGEPFRLLYVGSWIARKGVDLLAPIMYELGAGFELYYTGGPASEKYKLGTPTNMHDIGRLKGDEDIVKAMQLADALLFPSRSEGFGLVAAEAMSCGLPVITTLKSALLEVVGTNGVELICPEDDIMAFANAGRHLAENVQQWNSLKELARDRVVERFSLEEMMNSYIHCYRKHSYRD